MASFVILAALLLAGGTGKWEEVLVESGRSETQNFYVPSPETAPPTVEIP